MKAQTHYDFSATIPAELKSEFANIQRTSRRAFVNMMDEISTRNISNLVWWVSNAASRNVYCSRLYEDFCTVILCERLARKTEGTLSFRVRSRAVARAVSKAAQGCRVTCPHFQKLRDCLIQLRDLRDAIREILRRRRSAIQSRHGRAAQSRPPGMPVILFETFIVPQSFEGGSFRDRYFGRLLEILPEEHPVYFLYEFYGITDFDEVMSNIRTDGRFIVPEDFLQPRDFLRVFLEAFLLRGITIPSVDCAGADFSGVVVWHLRRERFYFNTLRALLQYHVLRRMKLAGWDIRLFVNWWENQWMDRAEHAAFHTFYPESHSVGYYGGTAHSEYMNSFPISSEVRGSVLPDEIALIGSGWIEGFHQYTNGVRSVVWPAYRYSNVWTLQRLAHEGFMILVALPILMEESMQILRIFAEIADELAGPRGISIRVRPHPGHANLQFAAFASFAFPASFAWANAGSIDDALSVADLLATGWSSTNLQAISLGVPVVQFSGGAANENIPADVPRVLWENAHDSTSMLLAIRRFHEQACNEPEVREEQARKVRARYFAQDTGELPSQFDILKDFSEVIQGD